jgi:hypothetical protein
MLHTLIIPKISLLHSNTLIFQRAKIVELLLLSLSGAPWLTSGLGCAKHNGIVAVFNEMRHAQQYPRYHYLPFKHTRAMAASGHDHVLSRQMPLEPAHAAIALRYVHAGRQPVGPFWQFVSYNLQHAQLGLWTIARGIRDGDATVAAAGPQYVHDIVRCCDVTLKAAQNMAQGAQRQTAPVARFGIGVACLPPQQLGVK